MNAFTKVEEYIKMGILHHWHRTCNTVMDSTLPPPPSSVQTEFPVSASVGEEFTIQTESPLSASVEKEVTVKMELPPQIFPVSYDVSLYPLHTQIPLMVC